MKIESWINARVACLIASGLILGAALPGQVFAQRNTVTKERIKGHVVSQVVGDVACYLKVRDEVGREVEAMADFDLCAKNPKLQGKRVELGLLPRQVMDESCGGDPACKKTRQVQVATTVTIIDPPVQPLASPPATKHVSHCTATEKVVFACRTGTKLVSVCADPASGPKTGYMQYRFGKPDSRETLEINWPEHPLPASTISAGDTEAFSGGGAAWLRIRKGDYAYVVYSGIGRWGPNGRTQTKEGVVVEHRAKVIASLKCAQPATSELGPEWFGKVGIQSRGETFDLPD